MAVTVLQSRSAPADAEFDAALRRAGLNLPATDRDAWKRSLARLDHRPGCATIVGLAAPFMKGSSSWRTKNGGEESFWRGCFTHACNSSSIEFKINHVGNVLATSAAGGGLWLAECEAGLYCEVSLQRLKDRALAAQLQNCVESGRATGFSLTYYKPTCQSLEGHSREGTRRTLHTHVGDIDEISLMLPPKMPAYADTWVAVNGVQALARMRREHVEAIEHNWATLGVSYEPEWIEGLSNELPGRSGHFGFGPTWIRGVDLHPGTHSFLQDYLVNSGGQVQRWHMSVRGLERV